MPTGLFIFDPATQMFGIPDTSNPALSGKISIKVVQKVRYGISTAERWIEINFGCMIMNLTSNEKDLVDQ